jgi:hypothetical protein
VPTVRSPASGIRRITLYGLNVSTRPGPCGGRSSNQAFSFARSRMPSRVALTTSRRYRVFQNQLNDGSSF